MPSHLSKHTFLTALLFSSSWNAQAQVATGYPPFGSFSPSAFDTVNNANLNVHFSVPIVSKAGRGIPFSYSLAYDNSVWYPSSVSGVQTWTPVSNWGWTAVTQTAVGYISYSLVPGSCSSGQGYTPWNWEMANGFRYTDQFGTSHSYGQIVILVVTQQGEGNSCVPNNPSQQTVTIDDGSMYTTMTASISASPVTVTANVVTKAGAPIHPPLIVGTGGGTYQDSNGNLISAASSGGTTTFTDTLNTTALTVTGTSPMYLRYTNPSGGTSPYTVNYTSYSIQTAFGCGSIAEMSTTASLITSIVLPDNTQYTFSYEKTPGSTTTYTGRLASVTLPTGGTTSYTYTGGSNGITCNAGVSDGSTATLNRSTPDGPWKYAHVESGSAWTTAITDPSSNTTNMTFSGIYEQSRNTASLQTVYTCYNGQTYPCSTGGVSLPISLLNQYVAWPNTGGATAGTIVSENSTTFDGYGNVLDQYQYGYGAPSTTSPTPGPLLTQTATAYASLGNYIYNRPSSIAVKNGTGSLVALTTINYDAPGSLVSTTGVLQHNAVSGSRGNATSILYSTNNSNTLTWGMTYFDTGNVDVITDPNTKQTTQTFGACQQGFVTNIAMPLSLSTSYTWDCNGGVQLTETDENTQTWTWGYSDPNFWRLTSYKDPTPLSTITYTYPVPLQTKVESTLPFNSGNSVTDILTTLDGLGRVLVTQQKQSPTATTYDSVETSYDSFGRPAKVTVPYSATGGTTSGSTTGVSTTYDSLNRVTAVTDGGGGYTDYTYTQNNNDVLIAIGPAASGETTKQRMLEYDPLGRITSVCQLTTVSAAGACGQNTAENGFLTAYTYDALNDVTQILQNDQTGAGLVYSPQTRTYLYDEFGRMTSETNPETGPIAYVYDTDATCGMSMGDLVKKTDAYNNVTCYAYDALHRVTQISYPSGPNASVTPSKYFVYDASTVGGFTLYNTKNRLAEAYTGSPTMKITDLIFSYSSRGEVTDTYQYSPHTGSTYAHLTASYWPNGLLNTFAASPSNISGLPALTNVPDGEGRVSTMTASSGQSPIVAPGVTYNTAGQVTGVPYGNTDVDTFTYDPNTLRPMQYKFTVNGSSQSGVVSYNQNGDASQLNIVDAFDAANNQVCTYSYNALDRITGANCGSAWNANYFYDPFGNIVKYTTGTGTSFEPTYNSATNQFSTIPSGTLSYDPNGNLLSDGFHTYGWDSDGNLITVDGSTGTFDALDRRVELGSAGSYQQMLYPPFDPNWQMSSANGLNATGLRIPLPGQGQAVFNSSGLSNYRHANWQGSEPMLSWANNATPNYGGAFTPFGEKYAPYSAGVNGYFAGMLGIADEGSITDAYQSTTRLYHSLESRWVSPDPAGLSSVDLSDPNTLNRYAYAGNSPLINTDPSGLQACQGNYNNPCFSTSVNQPAIIAPAIINYPFWIIACGGWFGNDTDWAGVSPVPCGRTFLTSYFGPQGMQSGGSAASSTATSNKFVKMRLPSNAQVCSASTGVSFYAPPGFSVSSIAANGAKNGLSGAGAAVGQGGYYDFQRSRVGSTRQFFPGYTPVANVAVGAYVQGTGAPQWVASLISNTYAFFNSSNGATAQQAQFRNLGFSLAAKKATYSCHSQNR